MTDLFKGNAKTLKPTCDIKINLTPPEAICQEDVRLTRDSANTVQAGVRPAQTDHGKTGRARRDAGFVYPVTRNSYLMSAAIFWIYSGFVPQHPPTRFVPFLIMEGMKRM